MYLPSLVKHYLAQHQPLYAEITPSEAIYKSWIAIHAIQQPHPLAPVSIAYDTTKQFIVRWYEVHIPLLEEMKVMNRLLDESQACNFMRVYVSDEETLVKVLERWEFNWDNLVPYWKIEFPFQ